MSAHKIKRFLQWLWVYFSENVTIPNLFVDITFICNDKQREIFSYLCETHRCGYYDALNTLIWLVQIY